MDLWIRSQDKKTLTKISEVAISYGGVTIRGIIGDYSRWLGEYKTKERALEVLNEIQNKIKPALFN